MGMDEHSQSVITGRRAGRDHAARVGRRHGHRFERFWERLDAATTTGSDHGGTPRCGRDRPAWSGSARRNPGDLYEGEYEGLYCTGARSSKTGSADREWALHSEHPTLDLVKTRERNWFFRLSRYGDVMKQKITSGE
jgi:hypothetical protein